MVMPSDYQVTIPPELMGDVSSVSGEAMGAFLNHMRKTNPYLVLYWQLRDYFQSQLEAGKKLKKNEVNDAFDELQLRASIGAPVNTHSLYDKATATYGNEVLGAYREYQRQQNVPRLQMQILTEAGRNQLELAIREGRISEEEATVNNPWYQRALKEAETAYAEKQAKQVEKESTIKEQLKRGVYSQSGRVALQQAIAQGTITAEEAYTNNPYWQDYASSEVAKGQEQQAAEAEQKRLAVARGRVTPEGRRMLIEQGLAGPGDFFVPGSPEAQAAEAQRVATARATSRGSDAAQILADMISQAKSLGINTSSQEQVYQQMAVGGGSDEALAIASRQLGEAINAQRMGTLERQGQMLAGEYPDVYKQYSAKDVGIGGRPSPIGFGQWATSTGAYAEVPPEQQVEAQAFRQKQLADQSKMFTEYGTLYGTYRDYLGKAAQYQPFEDWATQTPEAKSVYEQMRKSNLLREIAAGNISELPAWAAEMPEVKSVYKRKLLEDVAATTIRPFVVR